MNPYQQFGGLRCYPYTSASSGGNEWPRTIDLTLIMRLLCQLSYVSMYAAAIDIACRVWRSVEDSNLCDVAADLGLAGQPLTYSGNAP